MAMAHDVVSQIKALEWQVTHELEAATKFAKAALEAAENAQTHYFRMYEACKKLFDMNAHVHFGMSWKAYFCKLTGYKTASRYYQLAKVYPAAMIIKRETGITPTEGSLRMFPRHIIDNGSESEIVETFNIAAQNVMRRKGKSVIPEKADYNAATAVIDEIRATLIQVGDTPQADTDAIIEVLLEKHERETAQRQREHIQEKSRWRTIERKEEIISEKERVIIIRQVLDTEIQDEENTKTDSD